MQMLTILADLSEKAIPNSRHFCRFNLIPTIQSSSVRTTTMSGRSIIHPRLVRSTWEVMFSTPTHPASLLASTKSSHEHSSRHTSCPSIINHSRSTVSSIIQASEAIQPFQVDGGSTTRRPRQSPECML